MPKYLRVSKYFNLPATPASGRSWSSFLQYPQRTFQPHLNRFFLTVTTAASSSKRVLFPRAVSSEKGCIEKSHFVFVSPYSLRTLSWILHKFTFQIPKIQIKKNLPDVWLQAASHFSSKLVWYHPRKRRETRETRATLPSRALSHTRGQFPFQARVSVDSQTSLK